MGENLGCYLRDADLGGPEWRTWTASPAIDTTCSVSYEVGWTGKQLILCVHVSHIIHLLLPTMCTYVWHTVENLQFSRLVAANTFMLFVESS